MTAVAASPQTHLALELLRLRRLARRRALWLKARFAGDPLAEYGGIVTSDARAATLLADEVDATAFYATDPEAVAITAELEALDAELGQCRAGSSPLAGTVTVFGLSDFERDVLVLALAPELDGGFARVCGYLTDDSARRLPTVRLALELLPDPDPAALGPAARLRRLRLIELGEPALEPQLDRALLVDERVRGHLTGLGGLDARLAALARAPEPALLGERWTAVADRLASALARRAPADPLPLVSLVARPGAGAEAIALAACRRVGLNLVVLDGAVLAHAELGTGALIEREALLAGGAFAVDTTTATREEHAVLERLLDGIGVPVFVISPQRWHSRRTLLTLEVPWPTGAERSALLAAAVGGPAIEGVGEVAEHFQLGAADITAAAASARELAGLRGTRPAAEDLWRACRGRTSDAINALAERIEPAHGWDDLVLPADALAQLHEIAAQATGRARVYAEWGFGDVLARGRGIAALFAGPSGTGKTLAAEILAGALEFELYRVDLARTVSKYIGETEKNLRGVVHAAERAGAMLLFDEADALFAGRTDVRDSRDRYANLQVDYLLQLMEGFSGLALLATNRRGSIDHAFLRRLRFVIEFPLPDGAARRAIWLRSFAPSAPLDDLDWDVLARLELTGGSIRTVAVNAAFLAAADGAIGMRHVMRAARREYAKLDRLAGDADFARWEAPS